MRRARSTAAVATLAGALALSLPQLANATPEDVLAGAFDAITGVPFASTMLGVVRQGEEIPTNPSALDARLSAVEAILRDMEPRLRLVEARLRQVQSEVVKVSNINRLRELQRIRAELAEINAELKTKPADPARRSILEFRAQQQADLIKNNVDFDIWKWSDVAGDQSIRTRFLVYPSFELYAVAINTWFIAIEANSGDRPQSVVANSGAALREHAAFLEARPGFRELLDQPQTLSENLRNAAFCRLEAVDRFSNAAGDCGFAAVCVDTMADKSAETDRLTLTMQPPTAGVLCTTSPGQSEGLRGEEELRAKYGAELMAALAKDLGQLAQTGSTRAPFVGQFPNLITAQIFSSALDAPVLAARGAAMGSSPAIPKCIPVVGGCSFGVTLSSDTAWTLAGSGTSVPAPGRLVTIRHNASTLCLDVSNSAATPGAGAILFQCNGTLSQLWNKRMVTNVQFTLAANTSNMCATVMPDGAGGQTARVSRPLFLQPCDGRATQLFAHSDSTVVGPH